MDGFEALSVSVCFFKVDGFQPCIGSWTHKLQLSYLPRLVSMSYGEIEAGAGLRGEIVGIPTIASPTPTPTPFLPFPTA